MGRLVALYHSTLGKKAIAAVTGIVLFGFVALHMAGNLKTFTGTDSAGVPHIDVYARFLRTMGEPALPYGVALWVVRIILLVALVLHVLTVIQLARRNRAARPIRYRHPHVTAEATVAAKSMLVTGLLLLGFVVVHLLQFTTGTIQVTPVEPEHVYANLYHAFRAWFVAAFYLAAMAMLGLHLYHGVWSLFQTLGVDNPDRNRGLRAFAAIAAIVVVAGFAAVPLLFLLGVMPAPPVGGP